MLAAGALVAGRYRVDEPLDAGGGVGGWYATDESTGGSVLLLATTPASPDAPTRAVLEAAVRTAVRIGHPGLRPLLGSVSHEGSSWLIYSWGAGLRPLPAPADPGSSTTERQVARWGSDLAAGLGVAHAAGLVHGAVGPERVVVAAQGSASLIGLGATAPPPSSVRDDRADDVLALLAILRERSGPGSSLRARLDDVQEAGLPPTANALAIALRDLTITASGSEAPSPAPCSQEGDGDVGQRVDPTAVTVRQAEPPDGQAVVVAEPERPVTTDSTTAVVAPEPPRNVAPHIVGAPPGGRPALPPPRPPGPPPAHAPAGMTPQHTTLLVGAGPRWARRHRTAVAIAIVGLVVALLLAWALAAHSALTAGSTGARDTSASPIGDPATTDPCGVVTAEALSGFGATRLVPDYGVPESCGLRVKTPGPGWVDVSAEFAATLDGPPAGAEEQSDGYRISRPRPTTGRCARVVVVPDGTRVILTAASVAGAGANLCAMADAATASATSVLHRGPVARRAAPEPSASLMSVDACAVLNGSDLASVGGLNASRHKPGFGGWSCRWGADPAFPYAPTVEVGVVRSGPMYTVPEQIAGRSVDIEPGASSGHPTTCTAHAVQRTFTAADGTPRVESLAVQVYTGTVLASDPCGVARRLTAGAIPKLPVA